MILKLCATTHVCFRPCTCMVHTLLKGGVQGVGSTYKSPFQAVSDMQNAFQVPNEVCDCNVWHAGHLPHASAQHDPSWTTSLALVQQHLQHHLKIPYAGLLDLYPGIFELFLSLSRWVCRALVTNGPWSPTKQLAKMLRTNRI